VTGKTFTNGLDGQLLRLGIDVRVGTGTPGYKAHRRPLWKRRECDILDVLAQARENYLRGVKSHYPDRGGNPEILSAVVRAWQKVKKAFTRRGYEISRRLDHDTSWVRT
jgi:hypothetical protein